MLKSLQKLWNEFLFFSYRERFASFLLLAVTLVLVSLPFLMDWLSVKKRNHFLGFDAIVGTIQQDKVEKGLHTKLLYINQADSIELVNFGFKPFIVKRILNYKEKYGDYKSINELSKIYSIDIGFIKSMESRIVFSSKKTKFSSQSLDSKKFKKDSVYTTAKDVVLVVPKQKVVIDINTADSFSLLYIKGMNMTCAKAIIKHREKLGGFVNYNQLAEVWCLDSSKRNNVSRETIIGIQNIKKIKLNITTKEELAKHPYIGYKWSKVLIAFRDQHFPITNAEQLLEIKIMEAEVWRKIVPYLDFSVK